MSPIFEDFFWVPGPVVPTLPHLLEPKIAVQPTNVMVIKHPRNLRNSCKTLVKKIGGHGFMIRYLGQT